MHQGRRRNCKQTSDVGVYYRCCAVRIMAKALRPYFGACRKKVHRSVSATSSAQPCLIGDASRQPVVTSLPAVNRSRTVPA